MSYDLRPRPGQPQQPAAPQTAAVFNSEWSLPGKAPTPSWGLENEGNYCYMNSVLVALMHCAVFVNWLASHARNCQSLSCIACGIKSLATVYWQKDADQTAITDALKAFRIKFRIASWGFVNGVPRERFDMDDQQDANEFFYKLIDYMRSQLPINELVQMNELFYMTRVTTLICPACGNPSPRRNVDSSLGIPLDVASSIAEILRSDRVFGTDRLEGVACASANCSHQSDRDQLRSFADPPKILAVELRRFEYDYQTGVMHKNPAPIDFPSTLDLSPFAENNERVLYHLKSVVHHQGSLRAGHYIAYGLGPRRSWSRMNDHRVRRSNFNEASTNSGSNGFTPYMLFYQRHEDLRRQPAAEAIAAAGPGTKRVFDVMNDQLNSAERQLKRNRKAKVEERKQRQRLRRQ